MGEIKVNFNYFKISLPRMKMPSHLDWPQAGLYLCWLLWLDALAKDIQPYGVWGGTSYSKNR